MTKIFLVALLMWLPLFSMTYESLHTELAKDPADWMEKRIKKDLAPFEGKLSKQLLDEMYLYAESFQLVRIKIINGVIHTEMPPLMRTKVFVPRMLKAIKLLHSMAPLPDVDFVLSLGDKIDSQDHLMLPIFVVAKYQYDKNYILFPDWYAVEGYRYNEQGIQQGTALYPWNQKKEIMFWRGSWTGVKNNQRWKEFARPKLAILSKHYPDILDAKLTSAEDMKRAVEQEGGLLGKKKGIAEHLAYKYLVDVDGHSCTWPRIHDWLMSNSVLLKQMSGDIQWFYEGLVPYYHFVPIAADLSDLISQFHWARMHDAECQEMTKRSNQFVKDYLTQEAIYHYIYCLIHAYAKMQQPVY